MFGVGWPSDNCLDAILRPCFQTPPHEQDGEGLFQQLQCPLLIQLPQLPRQWRLSETGDCTKRSEERAQTGLSPRFAPIEVDSGNLKLVLF